MTELALALLVQASIKTWDAKLLPRGPARYGSASQSIPKHACPSRGTPGSPPYQDMNQKEKRKTPNMHLQCTPTPRPRRERNWPPQTNPRAADQTHPVDMGNEWFSILVLLTLQPAQAISGVYHSLANGPITFLPSHSPNEAGLLVRVGATILITTWVAGYLPRYLGSD